MSVFRGQLRGIFASEIHRGLFAILVLLFALGLSVAPSRAQTVRGALVGRETGQPIPFALVHMVRILGNQGDTVASALTGQDGLFSLTSQAPGTFYLEAAALGYLDEKAGILELGEGGEMRIEFRLRPRAIGIEALLVNVKPGVIREAHLVSNGFYGRLLEGLGRFITPADIEKSHSLKPTDLLFNIGGLEVVRPDLRECDIGFTPPGQSPSDPPPSDCRSMRITIQSALGSCNPPIYVDGIMMSADGRGLDQVVNMLSIEAMEIYRGAAQTPLQWGGTASAGCGAVVVWTKQGRP